MSKWYIGEYPPKDNLIEIGMPGKFDPVFALKSYEHSAMLVEIYIIVWKDTKLQVDNSGGFLNPIEAENWVEQNRNDLIRLKMEEILL